MPSLEILLALETPQPSLPGFPTFPFVRFRGLFMSLWPVYFRLVNHWASSFGIVPVAAAALRNAHRRYQKWKINRSEMQPEDRNATFWNDRRYEKASRFKKHVYNTFIVVGGIFIIFMLVLLVGLNKGWW
jgi:hypothetical protein